MSYLVNPYMVQPAAVAGGKWEFIDEDILTGSSSSLSVSFSNVNFSDVMAFVIVFRGGDTANQDQLLRIGNSGSVVSSSDYEQHGIINQANSASYYDSSYKETHWDLDNSNFGGLAFGVCHVTFNPVKECPQMTQMLVSDNTHGGSRTMAGFWSGGWLDDSALTSLGDVEVYSSNNFQAGSSLFVYKVLNS